MVSERVVAVIAETTKIDPARLTPESTFDDLGIDSLDAVEIMFGLEEEFDIEIPDEQARDARTVGQVIEMLKERMGES